MWERVHTASTILYRSTKVLKSGFSLKIQGEFNSRLGGLLIGKVRVEKIVNVRKRDNWLYNENFKQP